MGRKCAMIRYKTDAIPPNQTRLLAYLGKYALAMIGVLLLKAM